MLDRAIVLAQAETYKAFIAHLNASPATSEKLRRTMQTPPPWK